MQALYIIPARAGSKGLPGKNVKPLNGKPLISYSIDIAKQLTKVDHICVTTDSHEVKQLTEQAGISVPFLRPFELSNDTASMNDVLVHALSFYQKLNNSFDVIVLLQPTSPLRKAEDVMAAISVYNDHCDMVMSVCVTKSNPYFVLFEEEDGFLVKSKKGSYQTRQKAPKVYQANGAVYVINVKSLLSKKMDEFTRVAKYVMPEIRSVDIDTELDFAYCEFIIQKWNDKHSDNS